MPLMGNGPSETWQRTEGWWHISKHNGCLRSEYPVRKEVAMVSNITVPLGAVNEDSRWFGVGTRQVRENSRWMRSPRSRWE